MQQIGIRLLSVFGANQEAVKEVEIRETDVILDTSSLTFSHTAEDAVGNWIVENRKGQIIESDNSEVDFIVENDNGINAYEVISVRHFSTPFLRGKIQRAIERTARKISAGIFDHLNILLLQEI